MGRKEFDLLQADQLKEVEGIFNSFFEDMQEFAHVPRSASHSHYPIGKSQYQVIPKGLIQSGLDDVYEVGLIRATGVSSDPKNLVVWFEASSLERQPVVISLRCTWEYKERPDGILFTSTTARRGRINGIVQVVRPNGYFDLGDPENNRRLVQTFQCYTYLDYRMGLVLQLGYHFSKNRKFFYYDNEEFLSWRKSWGSGLFEIGGKRFLHPTSEEVIEALKNIKEGRKAIEIESLSSLLDRAGKSQEEN